MARMPDDQMAPVARAGARPEKRPIKVRKQLWAGLSLAAMLLLAASVWGNRIFRSHPPAKQVGTRSMTPNPAASQSAPDRPSPFSSPHESQGVEPEQVVQPSSHPSGVAGSPFHAGTRSFEPPRPIMRGSSAERLFAGELPLPPEIKEPSASTAANRVFERAPCCIATATYEPAKLSRLQRVIGKVPGLRKFEPYTGGGEGFVPPQALHQITFVLPAGASPLLMERKRMNLKASVDQNGNVTRVELLSLPDEDLLTLAAYAARQWQFLPARRNNKVVASEIILHFRFEGE
jgi:hypothetical protein